MKQTIQSVHPDVLARTNGIIDNHAHLPGRVCKGCKDLFRQDRDAGKIPKGYITGLVRDQPLKGTAHLYKGDFNNPGPPMCSRGWNRDNGTSYSIWRGNTGTRGTGICKICLRRAQLGKDGVGAKNVKADEPK